MGYRYYRSYNVAVLYIHMSVVCALHQDHDCGMLTMHIHTTGCTNEFVTVEIDSTTSTLTCRFQNNLNTVEKTCSAVYSLCNQEDIFTTMGNSTSEFPNQVTLQIPSGSDCYTYTIRASDGTSSVMVQGRVDPGKY